MERKTIILLLSVFILGWFIGSVESSQQPVVVDQNTQQPATTNSELLRQFKQIEESLLAKQSGPQEQISPHNWIKMEDILVLDNEVRINIENPEWAMFTNTNSMDPVLDAESNAIEIRPQSTEDIHLGDIVAYKSKYHDGSVTHRVIDISEDNKGWYATVKGDNNPRPDPGKIRFDQIERVVVAIIY